MTAVAAATFGASLVPLSQSLMMETYSREEQGKAMAMWGVGTMVGPSDGPVIGPTMMAMWGVGTMVGPITGPSLGGWLTDEYSWRWVFYINLPVGILCATGLMVLIRNQVADRHRSFDILGFSLLAIAIGTFQLMLDRGQQLDWFDSGEIVVETVVAGVTAAMFVLHMLTHEHPFLSRELFRDRNLMVGLIFTAVAGLVLIVTATLMPPFLQQLKGYPTFTAGIVMAPRGAGMMLSMMVVSRLIGRFDARWIISAGLTLCGFSLWEMSLFNLNVSESQIVWNGIYLGLGLGLVFPPLTTLAFATIPNRLRTEGAAINALLRNLGASVGIATLVSMLERNTQSNRSAIAEAMSVFNPLWRFGTTPMEHGIPVDRSRIISHMMPFGGSFPYGAVPTDDPAKIVAMWGEEMVRQASMMAYMMDFHVMTVVTVAIIPLLFFMRRQATFARPSRR